MVPEEIDIKTYDLNFNALKMGDGDRYAFLFHGFPDDAGSMIPLMERLAGEGYTAISPYMRGYGDTDTPELVPDNYSVPKLASDIVSIKNEFSDEEPVMIGHDWGAIAVTAASQLDPNGLSSCVSMAVPPNFLSNLEENPSQVMRSWYMSLFQIPGFSEEVLRRNDFALIERLWDMWSPNWDYPEDRISDVKETFRKDETVEASVLYYRSFFKDFLSLSGDSLSIEGIEVPSLVIAGGNDGCISQAMFSGAEECFDSESRLEVVNGAGHFMHQEKPGKIGDLVIDFLD